MKIEVIVEGKCSISVRTAADDYAPHELERAARSLARIATRLVKDTHGSLKKQPFGFQAAAHTEDQSRCHDDIPAELEGADQEPAGYLPGGTPFCRPESKR
ncbi:hypothetical protein [Lentzea sp. NBRC 102530]|uniref:hypothetical protein n=1 Tax=Lentzea sp. NBRC 102530 TaxID=3032201 RepID=UPI0024A261CA|nr:hypothetical protein [Lentzea sp. NBRC 102530]GLY55321.1 hypothetical protein Lesp01_89760 [Lentzea sp. NBRC 102530]